MANIPAGEPTYFLWKIINFNLSPQLPNEPICSPYFSLNSFGTAKFSLYLYPRGTGKKHKCMSLKLIRHKSDSGYLFHSKYELLLRIVEDGKENKEKVLHIDFAKHKGQVHWIWPDAVQIDAEKTISLTDMKNDFLLYNLDIYLKIIPIGSATDSIWDSKYLDLAMLSSDLSSKILKNNFYDLNFIVSGDNIFKAHKAIIFSRYPTLAKKLGISGNQIQEFKFCTDPETIQILLKYLYTGRVDKLKVSSGLYDLLENAELPHLKNLLFPIPSNISVVTNVCVRHCNFRWRISNFSSLQDDVKLHYNFYCDELLKWAKMRITFYFARNDKNEQCIAFALRRIFSGVTIRMKCRISFVEVSFFHKEYDHIFENEMEWKIPDFSKTQALMNNKDLFLRNDMLDIKFEFKISDGTYTSDTCNLNFSVETLTEHNSFSKDYWTLQQDLIGLYKNPTFSDVTLHVGKEIFPAHKLILSLRSVTFRNMFIQETFQESSSKVIIEDFDPSAIKAMLSYIYSGKVFSKRTDFEFVSSLYAAANQYRLSLLKEKCGNLLKLCLCVKNAGDILLLADVHEDTILKKHVHDFACSNAMEILNSREWKRIMTVRLDLAEELLHVILEVKN